MRGRIAVSTRCGYGMGMIVIQVIGHDVDLLCGAGIFMPV